MAQQDLEAAGGPAQLLLGVGLDGLGGVTDGQGLREVDRLRQPRSCSISEVQTSSDFESA